MKVNTPSLTPKKHIPNKFHIEFEKMRHSIEKMRHSIWNETFNFKWDIEFEKMRHLNENGTFKWNFDLKYVKNF